MDKQKTITIKINGKDRSYMQEKANDEDQTTKEKKPKISAWDETAASQESADDHFEWVLPDPVREDKPEKKLKKEPKTKTASKQKGFRFPAINKTGIYSGVFPRIILNIVLAILVGLGFGFIILNTVTSERQEGVQPSVTEPGTGTEQPISTETMTVEFPAISTFIVQGGVFSTKESVETALQSLAAKGIQGQEFSNNGQFALFLATAGSLEEAKALATEFESKGAEVFAKPYEIAAASVQGLTKAENEVVAIGPELYPILATGNTSNTDSASKVEAQLGQLTNIDETNMSNQNVSMIKTHLEKAATAFLANQSEDLQAETLAFLAAWQSIPK